MHIKTLLSARNACFVTFAIILISLTGEEEESTDIIDIELRPEILSRVSSTNISEKLPLAAVAFVEARRDFGPVGLGTVLLDATNGMRGILTSKHIFPQNRWGRGYFKMLRPMGEAWLPIERVEDYFEANNLDIVLCIPGKSRIIEGCSARGGSRKTNIRMWSCTNIPPLRSNLSGETIPVIGLAKESDGTVWSVLRYESLHGESGLGFLALEKEIYVVSSIYELTADERKFFSLPNSLKYLTLAQTVRLKF
ncbi:MAG: hypothetical protein Q7R93_01775 [bacterium]|nr:hypothetical protein [bacterium]